MSDTGSTKNGGAPVGDAAMGQTVASGQVGDSRFQVNVLTQYVKDLSFENPGLVDMIKGGGQQPSPKVDINLQVNVNPQDESDRFEVVLLIKIEGKKDGGGTVFIAELTYAGLFLLQGLPQQHLMPFLYVECPRLLFPFARAILAELTRDGGLPPLMLNPIDFAELFRRQAQAAQEQAKNKGA